MSPKTKKQFEEIRQRSAETIKQAALELFAHNGYHSTSISQIAQEAGVSKGLVYNYFESKEELLHQILLQAVEAGEAMMERELNATDDPNQQLRNLIESSFAMLMGNLQYWKLLTSLAFQTDVLTTIEPVMRQRREIGLQQMDNIFARKGAKNPRLESYYFGAVLDGVVVHLMSIGDEYPLEELKQLVIERFCM